MTGSRSGWRVALAVTSLLVVGAVLGVAFDRFHHRAPHVIVHRVQAGGVDAFALLDSLLTLRDDQRDRVRSIVSARQPQMDSVWRRTHVSLRTILDATISDLDSVLDAEQRARLREFSTAIHDGPPGTPRFRH